MTAFRAAYADLKIVKTRGVCQVILELPLEQADAALEILGGVPRPDREVWVGVARLTEDGAVTSSPPTEQHDGSHTHKDRRPFHTLPLPTQAALLCQDERFQTWAAKLSSGHSVLYGEWESAAREVILAECGITSRSELRPETKAAHGFLALVERYRRETGLEAEPR